MTTQTPKPTYILSVKFSDGTGSMWVRVYGDNALPIMKQMTPDKFKVYLDLSEESREQEVKDQLNKLNHASFSVMVKPSISEYNGQENLSYFASKVFDFSYKRNNDFLIERLTSYTDKPDITV
jgi:hypothetical protein